MEPVHHPTTPIVNPMQQAIFAKALVFFPTMQADMVAGLCLIAIESDDRATRPFRPTTACLCLETFCFTSLFGCVAFAFVVVFL